jgi:hypothetical protein
MFLFVPPALRDGGTTSQPLPGVQQVAGPIADAGRTDSGVNTGSLYQ